MSASFADNHSCHAGLEVIVVENRLEGDEVRTDLEALQQHIERIGADNIVAVVSTSSCFTPRIPDRFVFQSNSVLVFSFFMNSCVYFWRQQCGGDFQTVPKRRNWTHYQQCLWHSMRCLVRTGGQSMF